MGSENRGNEQPRRGFQPKNITVICIIYYATGVYRWNSYVIERITRKIQIGNNLYSNHIEMYDKRLTAIVL